MSQFIFFFRDSIGGSIDLEDYKNFPIFIKPINFRGTVSSSLIFINHEDKVDFIERSWDLEQNLRNESRFSFIIDE